MVVLDRFSGGNLEGWIFRAELYFTYLGFSKKDWLPLPYHYLDGEALAWFDWLFRNKQFFDWNHFKEKLKLRFHTRIRQASGGCLAIHQQRKLVENFLARDAAIPSWCNIYTSPSPQYWNKHLDSNNLNLAYEVLEQMVDRATSTLQDDEADVEPCELPEKHIDVDSMYGVADGSHIEVEILTELQAGNALMTKKEEFSEEGQVFDEMSHNCCSTVLADEFDLEDGDSEKDKVPDGLSQTNHFFMIIMIDKYVYVKVSWLNNGRRILDDKRDTVLGSSVPPTTVYCASHEMLLGAFESVRSSKLALALSPADGKPSIRRGAIRRLCFAYVSAPNEQIFGNSTLMLRVVVTASTARFLELICGCSCNRKFAPHTIIAWIHQNGSKLEKPLDCLLLFDLEDPYVGQHGRANVTHKASKIIAATTTMLQERTLGDWITLALGSQINTKLVLLKYCYILLGFFSQAVDGGDPRVIGYSKGTQDLSHHDLGQNEVYYAVTIVVPGMSRAWYCALNSAQEEFAGACHPVNFTSIEVNITTASLPKPLISRILDPNLEDKVLMEEGSIVVNMDNSNNAYGPIIWTEASQVVGPRAKLRKGQGIRQPNKRFALDPG
ncbi:hypothetical protein A4A49_42719 [Nicotiana attenuata]|uniref:Retrotransposon gag domain-containing protein n=1 Tax=Nicotiana attenuata TaxID=49451 RepID=A0A1J6KAJ5_NICAT|nr:hypothetical protein A4A49_42719 [Nicotiana attenuata]